MQDHAAEPAVAPEGRAPGLIGLDWGTSSCRAYLLSGQGPTFAYSAGYVTIPTGPGLGIDVNEDYVSERALEGHRWRNPVWRHADGSVAEW